MSYKSFGPYAAMAVTFVLAPATFGSPLDDAVVPIQVALGTATTLSREPATDHEVFGLRAAAGQTLLVQLNPCCAKCAKMDFGEADSMRVVYADAKPPSNVSSRIPKEEAVEFWMNALPSSGNYQIVVTRPSKKPYTLRISLIDAGDPMIAPGLAVDRVSMNPGLLPPGKKLEWQAYQPASFCEVDDRWPARLSAEGMGYTMQIMSLAGLKKAWWGDLEGLAHLARLEQALRQGAKPAKPPRQAFQDSALAYWGGMEFIEGKSWRGLRWIGSYAQDRVPLSNPLQYMVEAITNDGRYYILMNVEVKYPNLPGKLSQVSAANAALNAARPELFKPDLATLDAAARSVELR